MRLAEIISCTHIAWHCNVGCNRAPHWHHWSMDKCRSSSTRTSARSTSWPIPLAMREEKACCYDLMPTVPAGKGINALGPMANGKVSWVLRESSKYLGGSASGVKHKQLFLPALEVNWHFRTKIESFSDSSYDLQRVFHNSLLQRLRLIMTYHDY